MIAPFFARRYLFSRKSRSVINFISGVSVLAVAMPVAAMIILLSVFNGFEELARSMSSAFDAPLTVTPARGQLFERQALDSAALARLDGVGALSFTAEQTVLLSREGRQVVARLRGVDDRYGEVMPIAASIGTGRWQVRLGDLDRLVLGRILAHDLGVRSLADSRVTIYVLRRSGFSSLLPLDGYARREVKTAGIYSLDADTEQTYALTSLRLLQELSGYGDRATALLIGLQAGADPLRVRDAVAEVAGSSFRVRTQQEMNPSFHRIVVYEKWGIFFISLLVLVVASFSIVGALAMLIVDKRKDMAVMEALGSHTRQIRRIFMAEGVLIAALGTIGGVVLGTGLTLLQQRFGLIEIPAETFISRSYPVRFRVADLLLVVGCIACVATIISRMTVYGMIRPDTIRRKLE